MLRIILIIVFWGCISVTFAQSSKNADHHALGLEAGKLGLVFHIIYDYRFKKLNWGLRANAGKNFEKYLEVYQAGAGAYYLLGKKNDHLETGLDLNYFYADEISDDQRSGLTIFPVRNANTLFTSGNLGYRHYGARTVFRIGVSKGYIHSVQNFYTGAYISFGFTF
ncbi:MAG: hypothetical protein K2X48_04250 [Chitinophagaceae bacterium]|nr:hypothetical protein [Chitinophagaceae bacterium]